MFECDYDSLADGIKISLSGYIGLHLVISESPDGLNCRFWTRTNSWHYIDERTDIHDVIILLFALKLRSAQLCSTIILDDPNDFGVPECEIYSCYASPLQINYSKEEAQAKVLNIIHCLSELNIFFFQSFGCPCKECQKREKRDFNSYDVDSDFESQFIHASPFNYVNKKKRNYPEWQYHRDFKKKVTVIKSAQIAEYVRHLAKSIRYDAIRGLSGDLLVDNNFHNFLPTRVFSRLKKILARYDLDMFKRAPKIILDNKMVFIIRDTTFVIDGDFSGARFKIERDRLRERHDSEYNKLFKPSTLTWSDKLNGENFENLIKDLFKREPEVKRVRKVAHTNEADGGKDLLITKIQLQFDKINMLKAKEIEVIVQCKAHANGVSKNDVTDIRDIVEDFNYDGYFLAVSSYTKRSLTDHLERLRLKNNFYVDWWTEDEIFQRLTNHKDLIMKYSNLIISR